MKVRAYIDESGHHSGSEYFSMGGVVSSFNKWKKFERGWRRALDAHHEGKPIHAKDLLKMRDNVELVDSLFVQAEGHVHFGLTVTLNRQEFREFYKIPGKPGHELLDSEYGLMFGCWTESARNIAFKVFVGMQPTGIWFVLEQSQYLGSAASVYREIETGQDADERLPFKGFSVGKKELPGLQLSDMMAHMAWRREHRDEPGFVDIPDEISPEVLKKDGGNPFPIFRIKLGNAYLERQRMQKLESRNRKRT